jgi:hypothetical protein
MPYSSFTLDIDLEEYTFLSILDRLFGILKWMAAGDSS